MKKEKATQEKSSLNDIGKNNTNNVDCNLARMLRAFASGSRLQRFQAEMLGDHVLNSTVSDLQLRYGLYFSRKWTKVPNRFGKTTCVMSYWLEGKDLAGAKAILGMEDRANGY